MSSGVKTERAFSLAGTSIRARCGVKTSGSQCRQRVVDPLDISRIIHGAQGLIEDRHANSDSAIPLFPRGNRTP